MMQHHRIKLDYDNRFGFGKYCSAFWTFDSDRVGEQFIFRFPNGVEVSVIRSTRWNYQYTAQLLSTAASLGFACGLYEALVTDRYGNTLNQDGYLNHKQVHKFLSRWQTYTTRSEN